MNVIACDVHAVRIIVSGPNVEAQKVHMVGDKAYVNAVAGLEPANANMKQVLDPIQVIDESLIRIAGPGR